MQFSDIYGNDKVKQKLITSVKNNHVAHAQLFMGREGSAQLPLAMAYAQFVNCENPGDIDSCGTCPSCSKYKKLIHPDLHFVYPTTTTKEVAKDATSAKFINDWRSFIAESPYQNLSDWSAHMGAENKQCTISVEESRNLKKNLSLKSFESKYKVVILWLPELMHPSASNSILKILEEPPERTLFLLVSNNSDNIIITILSRCQAVRVHPFTEEQIKSYLIAQHNQTEGAATSIGKIADGNLHKAIQLMSEYDGTNDQKFKDWMRLCYACNFTELVNLSDEFQKFNKENQKSIFQYGLKLLREVLVFPLQEEKIKRLSSSDVQFVEGFSKNISEDKVERISKLINEAYRHIERNASPRIVFLDTSLSISGVIRS